MKRSGVLLLWLTSVLVVATPAQSGNYLDDVCPDEGGRAFIVDTPAEALTIADDYNRPDCRLIIRTSLERAAVLGTTLHISAKSITIEGPLEIDNGLVDSRIVLSAADGDIAISGARISARKEIRLECLAPATCSVSVQKRSHLSASHAIRTVARGAVTIDDSKLASANLDLHRAARP